MNKTISTSFMILCLLSILFLMECKISVKANPTTWTVDGDGSEDFRTIQEAINNATDGDTILVHEGTYEENVDVNKSVSLIGEDRDSTIVDGDGNGNVISIMVNNVSIESFTITRSGTFAYDSGISVDHSSGNHISHNTITNNYYGIGLYSSSNNVISGNTITNNNYDGLDLYYSSNNVISGNTITNNNRDGLGLYYSSNNVISGNTITNNNYDGLGLYYSSNNVISGNTITNNNHGMYLTLYSNNNIVYSNNFNNTYQVWSDSTNVWDDENEGNYWSDYTGVDLHSGPYQNETGSDGIGDAPYERIAENNIDNYPLMGTFSYFNVTLERDTHHVATICNSTISEFKFEIGAETGNKIIRFNARGEDGMVGFCRVKIPTELMDYPYIVLVGTEEIVPTLLDISNKTYVCLYFIYVHSSHTITIISSKTLHLYNELLDKHVKLQIDQYNLNAAYYALLNNYSILLGNYSQLQKNYRELNNSYQEYLLDYSESVHNIRNLMYIFAATTAIFIITTIYLSKRAHVGKTSVRARTQTKKRTHIP